MKENKITNNPIDLYIRIVLVSILVLLSFFIVKPFLLIIIWSALIAVALYPFYTKIINFFHGKKKGLVTTLFILILLTVVMIPTYNLSSSVVSSSLDMKDKFESGTLSIDPPSESVKEWPLIGEKVYGLWSEANKGIETFILQNKEPLKKVFGKLFSSFTGLMATVLLALFSFLISGILMMNADMSYKNSVKLANRLIPGKGDELITMIVNTIRSVVKGILLVALIQAGLAYLGFAVIGLPGAAFFTILVLVFAIIQVPPILVMIPAIAIVFSTSETTPAIIFTIYSIFVSLSDNILKPILLGKGLQTPMLIILIGALGGMMYMGMLGLFIGPVILSIAHQLYLTWIQGKDVSETTS